MLIVGLVIGVVIGLLVAALCITASKADEHFDDAEHQPKTEELNY